MAKLRVHQLAKELGISSKDLIDKAQGMGFDHITSHANTLDDSDAKSLRSKFDSGNLEGKDSKRPAILLRRRESTSGGEVKVITSRLSDGEEEVLEVKKIEPEESVEPPKKATTLEKPSQGKESSSSTETTIQPPVEEKKIVAEPPAVKESVMREIVEIHSTKQSFQDASLSKQQVETASDSSDESKKISSIVRHIDLNARREKSSNIKKSYASNNSYNNNSGGGNNNSGGGNNNNYNNRPPLDKNRPKKVEEISLQIPVFDDLDPNTKIKKERKPEIKTDRSDKFERQERLEKKRSRVSQDMGGANGRNSKLYGRKKKKDKKRNHESLAPTTAPMSEKKKVVKVDTAITLADLAHQMGVKSNELIKNLLLQGVMVTKNQSVSIEEASALAKDFGYEVQSIGFEEQDVLKKDIVEDSEETLEFRAPIVTVMGHVDHGKTSLLDAIRQSRVADSEAGGITQHIGAYSVHLEENRRVVFLDTPGHEAFTSMRARGAKTTDIVVLVVAADDGIMPQTIEAISHAKAANVPIVVAINKIDKAGADISKVKYALMQHDLLPEEFGGQTIVVPVSAKTKEGLPQLLESLHLQSEILELKANPNKKAKGIVVESRMEKGRGPVSTVLVMEGTLEAGDTVVTGMYYGRVKAMYNDMNEPIEKAGPATPVKIVGMSGLPIPGDEFDVVVDEKAAKQLAAHREGVQRQQEIAARPKRASLESLFGNIQEQKTVVNFILKADVQGTLEALKDNMLKIEHDEVEIRIAHSAVGGIIESDVALAATTDAIVIGFNVRADNNAQKNAENEGVEIRIYRVIYNLIDDVKAALLRHIAPTLQEKPIGQAEIRQLFSVPKAGKIAGCYITEGKITRGCLLRLYRENIEIHSGKVQTLRRFKDDAKEVAKGFECGIQIEGFQDIREGDMIEAYEIEEIKAVFE